MDVHGGGEKSMNLAEVKDFLKENIRKESEEYFGFTDSKKLDEVANNWFNDQENYDGRWNVINTRLPKPGRVLDMAAGCGTFVLNGLHNGCDVQGVEPEEWKREYFRKKIQASKYPDEWNNRIVRAVGERLPFEDEAFDVVTSYQTLEHVQDVRGCIQEMLRVLKPGGILYIKAPDYNCFFEPHYMVPFLPKMNKKLAAQYLEIIGRPQLGLNTLQWVTEKDLIKLLVADKHKLSIERMSRFRFENRKAKIRELLPGSLRKNYIINLLNHAWELKLRMQGIVMIGRCEKHIDLWITKLI